MSKSILDLEPKRVWHYFNEICKIPHGSGNEAGVRDYIVGVAKSLNLKYSVDKKGNLIIKKPANKTNSTKGVVFQGHMDMVCVAEKGKTYDPKKDPIKPYSDGEWVRAEGTSLGADNAIALSLALSTLESKDVVHGPLECLFTVEEETGFVGVTELGENVLEGKTLINMDSEVENTIYVGCAGGKIRTFKASIKHVAAPANSVGLQISVSDMTGGHSGLEIDKERGNAIKVLGRMIREINLKCGTNIAKIEGGSAHNVIPPNASAVIAVGSDKKANAEKIVSDFIPVFKNELSATDPKMKIEVSDAKLEKVLDSDSTNKIINIISAGPHGVLKMSLDIKGLVQTSINLANVGIEGDNFTLDVSSRSSVESEKETAMQAYDSLVNLIGGEVVSTITYPAWQPNLKSPLLKVFKSVYKELHNSEPIVTAIHAGLEAGVVSSKHKDMDMIAYGPDLFDVHSPNEKLNIKSAQSFCKFITMALQELAK